jgi:hypothetical protein
MTVRHALFLAVLPTLGTASASAASSGDSAEVRLPDDSVVCGFHRDADTPSRVVCGWKGSDDELVLLEQRGRAQIVPSTGTVRDPSGPVLRYGRTRRFGPLACRALRVEMECWSTTSTHGFVARGGRRPDLARHCGDLVKSGAGVYGVRANGVACKTARRVARTYYNDDREVTGWRCEERRVDLEDWRVRCTRGDALVRFSFGA